MKPKQTPNLLDEQMYPYVTFIRINGKDCKIVGNGVLALVKVVQSGMNGNHHPVKTVPIFEVVE